MVYQNLQAWQHTMRIHTAQYDVYLTTSCRPIATTAITEEASRNSREAYSMRCTDTSAVRHFGSKTLRQQRNTAEVSGHFGSTADVSYGLFGSAAEVSRGVGQFHPVSASVASDDLILSLYFVFILYL